MRSRDAAISIAAQLLVGCALVGCDDARVDRAGFDGGRSDGARPDGARAGPASLVEYGPEQVSLGDRLGCNEADLFTQSAAVQAARLSHGRALVCEVQSEGDPFATCTGNGRLRLFGLPVLAVSVMPAGMERGLQIRFRSDAATLATAVGRAFDVPLRPRPDAPGFSYNGGADARSFYVRPHDSDGAVFGCSLPAPNDAATNQRM